MRKLKLQVQMTANGFIGGPKGEMDWAAADWDAELKRYVGEYLEPVDCIVLGRKLAQGFIPYWSSHPEEEGADKFVTTKKVVFSKTLEKSEWDNTELAKGDLAEEIIRLKGERGKDIIAFGGASFVSALVKRDLIDEYRLFINPATIPRGLGIFGETEGSLNLKLIEARSFACGIVVLHYEPRR